MSQCLITVPYEVVANIISYLDFDDIINLGRTCKKLLYLLQENRICRWILEVKIPFSKEAITAKTVGRGYASAVRRVAKRRDAFANAEPFSIAIVGFGESYNYCNGVLCYIMDKKFRVLRLHDSSVEETIIGIAAFLQKFLPDGQSNHLQLDFLNYNEDVLCFLLGASESETNEEPWIIAVDIQQKTLLLKEQLAITEKIFVRLNRKHLFYGTHSGRDIYGNRRWVIRGYRFQEQTWFEDIVNLSKMVGSDIGSSVCFELHDGFFYALSSETSDEPEEVDWTSFYHCFRFPLDSPSNSSLEATDNNCMWRREHREGPIDDRWTSLRLDRDEVTNELRIVEARREWHKGGSRSRRSYYITAIEFPDKAAPRNPDPPSLQSLRPDLVGIPNVQLLATLTSSDNPHYMNPPLRSPQQVHPGDDGYSQSAFVLNKTKVRCYNTHANTYLDLVDDPLSSDWRDSQRLRLRVGNRKPLPLRQQFSCWNPIQMSDPTTDCMYRHSPIKMWPPETPEYDELYTLLNPPTHSGNVQGTADERSLVYCTGGNQNQPAAIIFINFDPGIKISGARNWRGPGIGEGPHIDGRANGAPRVVSVEQQNQPGGCKGKEKESRSPRPAPVEPLTKTKKLIVTGGGSQGGSSSGAQDEETERQLKWIWTEQALYKAIDRGVWLGRAEHRGTLTEGSSFAGLAT